VRDVPADHSLLKTIAHRVQLPQKSIAHRVQLLQKSIAHRVQLPQKTSTPCRSRTPCAICLQTTASKIAIQRHLTFMGL
jgi:hypothetical protein